MPDLTFTPRFYNDIHGNQLRMFRDEINGVAKRLKEYGIEFQGKVRPLAHRKDLYRIRFHGDWRLVIKRLSSGALRLVCILPRSSKIYDEQKRNAELDDLSGREVPAGKAAELERILGLGEAPPSLVSEGTRFERAVSEPGEAEPAIGAPDSKPEAFGPVPVEEVTKEELLGLFASPDLLRRFAELSKWSEDLLEQLVQCHDVDDVLGLAVGESQLEQLIDFLVDSQGSSDVERCYLLPDEDFETVAARPLESFLLQLDEEQKVAVDRPIDSGPFLVRGAAGTGKSVVCLYRMTRMIEQRVGESLFDGPGRPQYLFVSYTNALVGSSEALFRVIRVNRELKGVDVRFLTVDRLTSEIVRLIERDGRVKLPRKSDKSRMLFKKVRNQCINAGTYESNFQRISARFLEIEIEEVIIDWGIKSLDEYLALQRKGRKSALQPADKRAIWEAFERLKKLCEESGEATWAGWRRAVFDALSDYDSPIISGIACLVVDEVQDLSRTQLGILSKIVSTPKIVTLSSDLGQSIFRRTPNRTSAEEGFRVRRADTVMLRRSYRMTKEIQRAIDPIRARFKVGAADDLSQEPVFSGPLPELHSCAAIGHATVAGELIKSHAGRFGTNFGRFAVLVGSVSESSERLPILQRTFAELGIPYKIHNPKDPIDPKAHEVHVLTVASSKGLEFPHVIIPWVDEIAFSHDNTEVGRSEAIDERHRLLYVACSRAAESLALIRDPDVMNNFYKCLDQGAWRLIDHQWEFDPTFPQDDNDVPF